MRTGGKGKRFGDNSPYLYAGEAGRPLRQRFLNIGYVLGSEVGTAVLGMPPLNAGPLLQEQRTALLHFLSNTLLPALPGAELPQSHGLVESLIGDLRRIGSLEQERVAEKMRSIRVVLQNELKRIDVPPSEHKVFVVHGHDGAAREGVARFLEQIGLEPVILHERANKGRTLITKFREESADIGFAVVLMTPDDHGAKADAHATRRRARQNVVFELGFFIGKFGPRRVAALVKEDLERPSDVDGVVYINLDDAGGWKQQLGRELQAAGFEIDWNRVMR
jgi:predicted nucleotide-binding protein